MYADGSISGSLYFVEENIEVPNHAIEFEGREKSWGKRIVLDNCGDTDLEGFDYVAKLLSLIL